MAIGFIQITDGHGYQIITGAGRLSTMVAGYMMMLMDGCGCQVMNGLRPGFPGEAAVVVMDGLPLGPGLNFDISIGSRIPYSYWSFVPNRYINSPRINNYYINREKNVTIINNTTVINNTNITNNKTVYVTGPSATEVEKVTNEKIRPVKIVQKNTPGNTEVSGSTVSIYKPAVKETPQQNEQIKPSRIVNLNELKVRRENAGAMQNEIPGKEVQGKTVPVDH